MLAQLLRAAHARHDEEHVLEDDPGGVLEPAPLAGDDHAVDRLRPEQAAQRMVERDHDGRGHEHPPVAIEREERQRSEDVEVRLDAATGQVNQQRAHQHLRRRDDVARRRISGPPHREQRRKDADRAAQQHRRPDVHVNLARRARPGLRRDHERERRSRPATAPTSGARTCDRCAGRSPADVRGTAGRRVDAVPASSAITRDSVQMLRSWAWPSPSRG